MLVLVILLILAGGLAAFYQISERKNELSASELAKRQVKLNVSSRIGIVKEAVISQLQLGISLVANGEAPVNVTAFPDNAILSPPGLNIPETDSFSVIPIGEGKDPFSPVVTTSQSLPKFFQVRYSSQDPDTNVRATLVQTIQVEPSQLNDFAYAIHSQDQPFSVGGPTTFEGQSAFIFKQSVLESMGSGDKLIKFMTTGGPFTAKGLLHTNIPLTSNPTDHIQYPSSSMYPAIFEKGIAFESQGISQSLLAQRQQLLSDPSLIQSDVVNPVESSRLLLWVEGGSCKWKMIEKYCTANCVPPE